MDARRRRQIESLCLEALARDSESRGALLDEACAGDPELRREVDSLLAGRPDAAAFLEKPAWQGASTPLTPGTRLGPYEIESAIGAGGMGEVYQAHDTRLGRTVAVKVLPSRVAMDPNGRRRLEHEARAASALNHPHICTLYDIGEAIPTNPQRPIPEPSSSVSFLVMEHLDGETLARRLTRGKLPLAQALELGAQIAEALSAAHKHGIVHRDLKPGNVMLTKGGAGTEHRGAVEAKLLDFGLAKLLPPRDAGLPVTPVPGEPSSVSTPGMLVGTVPYMAPEQVEGKDADARADLWALGAMLYEMLTGTRAFSGGSSAAVMAAILEHEPRPLREVLPLTPPALDRLIRRCLAKDPDARWDSAHDVADELRWIAQGTGADAAGTAPALTPAAWLHRWPVRLLAAAISLAVLAAAGWFVFVRGHAARPEPSLVYLTSYPGIEQFPALSPDGTQVAFSWNSEKEDNYDIYVQVVGETEPTRLTTNPLTDSHPAWSPDGTHLAFQRASTGGQPPGIFLISVHGSGERRLAETPNAGGGLSWSPNGKWLAYWRARPAGTTGEEAGIYLLPVEGGEPERVTTPRAPAIDAWPMFSWDGRSLAFAETDPGTAVSDVFVQPLSPAGMPQGRPRQITQTRTYIQGLTWHPDGESVIVSAEPDLLEARLYRVPVDGERAPEPIEVAGLSAWSPTTSRAGNRLAFGVRPNEGDIWRLRPGRGAPQPLVKSSRWEYSPQYSPDGRKVAFTSNRTETGTEIWVANDDGSNPVRLTYGPGRNQGTARWSPDGRLIAFDSYDAAGQSDIYVIESSGGQPRRITFEPSHQNHPSFSHDGRWIYFTSNHTGRSEVWRAPVAGGGSKQLTTDGGLVPLESGDGKTLVYLKETGELFAKPLAGGPERRFASARKSRLFALVENRVYYWGPPTGGRDAILFYDLLSCRGGEVTQVTLPVTLQGLSVSPDRQTILFTARAVRTAMDLMLIEHFR